MLRSVRIEKEHLLAKVRDEICIRTRWNRRNDLKLLLIPQNLLTLRETRTDPSHRFIQVYRTKASETFVPLIRIRDHGWISESIERKLIAPPICRTAKKVLQEAVPLG